MSWNSSCNRGGVGPTIRPECPAEGPVKVSDLIGSRKEVFSIAEETSVHQAAQYLREKQVRSVGVMDANGKLSGVISQSDVSDKVAAENKCPAWMKTSDIMTRELVTVTPEMTVEDCLRLMEQNTIFRSEEHTSELQSRSDLVCRLLLEKKKKKTTCNLKTT